MGGITMWIARDKNNRLFLYLTEKPVKEDNEWHVSGFYSEVYEVDSNRFPEVKWEDEEPRELILK